MIIQQLREKKYDTLFKECMSLNKYQYLETLGIGSYGIAYLLQPKQSQEKYVLKRLRVKHKKNKKTQSNFQQEITFLKRKCTQTCQN